MGDPCAFKLQDGMLSDCSGCDVERPLIPCIALGKVADGQSAGLRSRIGSAFFLLRCGSGEVNGVGKGPGLVVRFHALSFVIKPESPVSGKIILTGHNQILHFYTFMVFYAIKPQTGRCAGRRAVLS